MSRLFVAIDLPADTTGDLLRVQPPPSAGIRLVEPNQMHLTLHYIGKADLEKVAEALQKVRGAIFPLVIEGVGQFLSADGAVTMWAGVRENSNLLTLRDAVATALMPVGFRAESRPYNPHIALARCEQEVSACYVDEFFAEHVQFELPMVLVTEFALFSSDFISGVPAYRREWVFPLCKPDE